jgi:PIN domain nuclease of toxin-antitoxin system
LNLLLDTHVWLWWLDPDPKLDPRFMEAINAPTNRVLVSAISLWEVQIKRQIGKLKVDGHVLQISLERGIEFLAFSPEHANEVSTIPLHHQDPFDRALLAQAKLDQLKFVTADRELKRYAEIVEIF